MNTAHEHNAAGDATGGSVRGVSPRTTLLLVDDDHRIRQALTLALVDEGFDVLAAASGAEALTVVAQVPPDLVLLDLMLPGVDGLEVCRRLRAGGDLPIIIITARTDSADVIDGLEAGADDYVTKPLIALSVLSIGTAKPSTAVQVPRERATV
ncbi:MAG: response regulator, partial [Pseudonocardia sp.]|nr:response regulator [Pseudonocardia sp.]